MTKMAIKVLVLFLILCGYGTALAGAVFVSYTGPTWLHPGYQFTVEVSELTPPSKYIGLMYTVNNDQEICVPCVSGDLWTCTIPVDYNNATVNWSIQAYPNDMCGGNGINGYAGTFSTSPTAIELTELSVQPIPSKEIIIGLVFWLIVSIILYSIRKGVK